MSDNNYDPLLEMYIFETEQLLEQLESSILNSEKSFCYTQEEINEIFRIMHTIKGSAAMMSFENISNLAHSIEDIFYYIREENPKNIKHTDLSDLLLDSIDFIKVEIEKVKEGNASDESSSSLIEANKQFLSNLKTQIVCEDKTDNMNVFKAIIFFTDDCQMESVRAFTVIHNLKSVVSEISHVPAILTDNCTSEVIKKEGFSTTFKTNCSYDEIYQLIMKNISIKSLDLKQIDEVEDCIEQTEKKIHSNSLQNSIISVSLSKLDLLMDLMGEMVIAEAMVIQNPDLKGLKLDNFDKAARQLHKITTELKDVIMSIRMVPLSCTFQKMTRIVRDMSKKQSKEVELKIYGEETEVDKNIIEHISDPLIHLVRNAIDHGIESVEEREKKGKPSTGKVVLEAKNEGRYVLITVKDDGLGLNKKKIIKRAMANNLIHKPESEITDKEIYNLVLLPGFSTNDNITEYSGRGVGMDIVTKSIEDVGGSVSIDSAEGIGTTVTLKIPLTLAIIDGMNISVGKSKYTIPIASIKESFKPKDKDILKDPDGNEMIMVRGQCYSLLRLHELYGVETEVKNFSDGILIMVEQEDKTICLFADKLIGQQQVVVKALPNYILNERKIKGLAGCTLLGDGSISLILDVGGL